MIEGERRELGRDIRAALDDGDEIGAEGLAEKVRHQRARLRRELGGLDEDAVSGGERRRERTRREVIGIVPRRDDADDPEGLTDDLGTRRKEGRGRRATLRLHPALEVLLDIADELNDGEELGD